MKKVLLLLAMIVSTQTFADVTLQTNNQELNPEITKYLSKKLEVCKLGLPGEVFKIEKVSVVEDRVDNGIIDLYYTIDISYDAVRNDVIVNNITVKVLDSDFDNHSSYEERLSFEVTADMNNFCR